MGRWGQGGRSKESSRTISPLGRSFWAGGSRLHGTDGWTLRNLMISYRQRLLPALFPPPPMGNRHHPW